MNLKYGLMDAKLTKISIFNEDQDPSHNLVIHRTSNCVIYHQGPQKPYKVQNSDCGFKSQIGKVFKPLGVVRQATPIYQNITKSFFNESYTRDVVFLKDEQKQVTQLKKIQEKTSMLRTKLKSLSATHDPQINGIKSRIVSTTERLKHSKAGKSLESSTFTKESLDAADAENNTHRQSMLRKKIIESARNLSFEQKLGFYEENPMIAERRIKTGHLPWEGPFLPSLPGTPDNSKYYDDKILSKRNTLKIGRKKSLLASINLAFLQNPKLLGPKGGQMLFQMISDEKNNVKTSNAEIEELNRIINRRIRIMKKKETGWENEVYRYAVNKATLKPTCKAANLINSYFSSE